MPYRRRYRRPLRIKRIRGLGLFKRPHRGTYASMFSHEGGSHGWARSSLSRTTHKFMRTYDDQTVVQAAAGLPTHFAYYFQFDDLPNYTEFTNLYDQYRVHGITVRLEPLFTENSLASTSTALKYIRVVHDYDDHNVLANESDYFQYANMRSYNPYRLNKIQLYPKVRSEVVSGGGVGEITTGARTPWCDCNDADIFHYGLKIFFPASGTSVDTPLWRIIVNVKFEMRTSR